MAELPGLELAQSIVERALASGGDFAELFAEDSRGLVTSIDESRIEGVSSGAEQGAGIRVVHAGTAYFAHVDGLGEADLLRAADEAAAALRGRRAQPQPMQAMQAAPQPIEQPPEDVPARRKSDLLRELDARGRSQGEEIVQLRVGYSEARRRIVVANSAGLYATDDRTRVRIAAQAVASRGDTVQSAVETLGGHRGFELLDGDPGRVSERACRTALTLLDAGPAPAGSMPVVVGGGFGGVLFHEMTGHGLEADHIHKGASVYEGRLGERVAEPLLNAFDDGALAGEWGTNGIDDEGTPTQKTQVIEDGRLVSYLHDRRSAERAGAEPTGNGRRSGFSALPIPRMTNTYIAPGDARPEDIISEVGKGFYAVSFAGGQVEPASGDFVFGVSEGYLIEDGKVTRPCRGATLIGNCVDALAAIDAVGDDFEMRSGICGKAGQQVPVGTGQGHVRIRELTVGGTAV
jgi:TldD protein